MNEPVPDPPYGRRPLPARSDWRRALGVYVAGRSRALTADEKRGIARQRSEQLESPRPGASRPGKPRYGVPVPERLAFHRTASTWRNDLPDPEPPRPSRSD